MSAQGAALGLGFLVASLVMQGLLFWCLRPQRLVGDEPDYVADRIPSQALWIRVPLHRMMMRAARRVWAGERHFGPRCLTSVTSALTVGLAVGAVGRLAGPEAAWLTGLVLLATLERAVLALHLWPDIAMGLLISVFALCVMHPSPVTLTGAAVAASLAFALRIEGAALVALALAVPLASGVSVALPALICALGIGALCLRARVRHGTWWPDTTFRFNVAVARTELTLQNPSTSDLMAATSAHVTQGTAPVAGQRAGLAPLLGKLAIRLKILLGPETFVTQRLLLKNAPGYRVRGGRAPLQRGRWLLRCGFPCATLVFAGLMPWMPGIGLALCLALIGLYAGLQTRGRYRMALLPLMAMLIGLGVADMAGDPVTLRAAALSALAMGLVGVLLWCVPERAEQRG